MTTNCLLFKRCFTTSSELLSAADPLRVCIVGSGVAGFSTAHQLIKHHSLARVDLLEKLPVPFGLIRYGVAPDHAEVKNCANHLTSIAESPHCRFIGNVEVGKDISLHRLHSLYHAVVMAYGAESDCKLGIPGEDLPGVYSARAFFSWYNGLPKYKDLNPDLSGEVAVIIGQGNVALDVARILLTPTELLEGTDICDHALRALRESRTRQVYLIGRQGPLQVAFSTKELRNMSELPGCRFHSDQSQFDAIKDVLSDLPRPKRRLAELMMRVINSQNQKSCKEWNLLFWRSPIEVMAKKSTGRVAQLKLEINKLEGDLKSNKPVGTGVYEELDCNMVIRSIGYRTRPVDGVPFEKTMRIIPNAAGRVMQGGNGDVIPGLYCSGWVKTGPVGAILNTMSSAYETADNILEDYRGGKLKAPPPSSPDITSLIPPSATSFTDWKLIDTKERSNFNGQGHRNKPREKIICFDEMLRIIGKNRPKT